MTFRRILWIGVVSTNRANVFTVEVVIVELVVVPWEQIVHVIVAECRHLWIVIVVHISAITFVQSVIFVYIPVVDTLNFSLIRHRCRNDRLR